MADPQLDAIENRDVDGDVAGAFRRVHNVSMPDRREILAKTAGRCYYCGTSITASTLQVDHMQPINRRRKRKRRFGRPPVLANVVLNPERDVDDNLVPACRACNRAKSNKPLDFWRSELHYATGLEVRFFFETLQGEVSAFPTTLRALLSAKVGKKK